jgi:hypothetical protein
MMCDKIVVGQRGGGGGGGGGEEEEPGYRIKNKNPTQRFVEQGIVS